MNAAAMVSLARNWTLVPDKTICQLAPSLLPRGATLRGESLANLSGQNLDAASAHGQNGSIVNMTAAGGQVLSLQFVVTDDSCAVKQLEHVQVRQQMLPQLEHVQVKQQMLPQLEHVQVRQQMLPQL